jgi:putative ABC transport system substrate-binding protein
MRRREFLRVIGGAVAAGPALAHGQQAAMPVIGFLHSGSPEPNARRVAGFRKGLRDAGLVEGENVAIEFRWAEGNNDKLEEMAEDLVRKRVAVMATLSSTAAAVAARKKTSTIPVCFLIADPPVELGLVASLNRPGGNATGIVTLAAEISAKRLAVLHDLVPQASSVTAILQPSHPSTKAVRGSLEATASALGVQLDVLMAGNDREIEEAYHSLKPGVPLFMGTDPLFFVRRGQLAALSARQEVPTIYDSRDYTESGGLMSYGPNIVRLWEDSAGHVARILKGANPADLPVVQASQFELVINVKAAKALSLVIPDRLMAIADDVIE